MLSFKIKPITEYEAEDYLMPFIYFLVVSIILGGLGISYLITNF